MVVVVIQLFVGNGSYLSRLIELSTKILLLPAPAKKKQLKILREVTEDSSSLSYEWKVKKSATTHSFRKRPLDGGVNFLNRTQEKFEAQRPKASEWSSFLKSFLKIHSYNSCCQNDSGFCVFTKVGLPGFHWFCKAIPILPGKLFLRLCVFSETDQIAEHLLLLSHSAMSDPLRPHGPQHARLRCPSLIPRVCSNSCRLSRWCHPAISFSVSPLLLLLSIFPSTRNFSDELALCIRWPKYWSFSSGPPSEYSGLTSFRTDWFESPGSPRS